MTMITAMMMTVTLTMAVAMAANLYSAILKSEELHQEREQELLRELLAERNAWALWHLGCGLGALTLIWLAKTTPWREAMEVSAQLAEAIAIFAASALFFAVLESLLAQRIAHLMARGPAKVRSELSGGPFS